MSFFIGKIYIGFLNSPTVYLYLHVRFSEKMLFLCLNESIGNSKESSLALVVSYELLGKDPRKRVRELIVDFSVLFRYERQNP